MTTHQLITDHLDVWTSADTEKKSGRGRSSGNATSVYGIKKLRELILELAVRGKLVPQDTNDGPASELLKRIQVEKTKLIAEGKIKNDKPLASISEKEKPFELPLGWEWYRLSNLCILENGDRGKNYPNKSVLVEAGIPFINAGHLQNGQIDKNQMTFITKELFNILRGGKFQENDILFCLRGSLGKSALVKGFEEGAIASSLVIIRLFPNLDATYFVKYFDCPLSSKMVRKYDNGTAQPNLSSTDLAKFLVPLPPLAEQHRIVAKVDELMALCDQLETQHNNAAEAHEKLVSHLLGTLTQSQSAEDFSPNWQRIAAHFDTLFTTEASIDVLKQTLLQLAVMGKLVPQDTNDEPASELFKRIQAEKAKLIAEGKIKKAKPLSPITEEEKPFDLPPEWNWVRFSDYATDISTGPFGSMIHQSDYIQGGVPLINPSHMIDDKIFADETVSVSKAMAKTLDSYAIYQGDIVMARRGEVGRIALVTESENEWLCGTGSFVLRFYPEVCRDFLRIFFRCNYARTYLAGEAVGTTMVNLNHGILKKMPLGLPSPAEQLRIVAKVDELMAICGQLKSRLIEANQLQQKLADVMVEQATA
jgi:type I restriction enzyme S subunit